MSQWHLYSEFKNGVNVGGRIQYVWLFSAIGLTVLLLACILLIPFFNGTAGKQLRLPFTNPLFYAAGLAFTLVAGLVAGSYPALYLSSFRPVMVLKGAWKAGRWASLPRKGLVVVQFTASIALIISTIIVFRQIQFANARPVGYTRDGLINIESFTPNIHDHFDAFRDDLLHSGFVANVAWSSSPLTEAWNAQANFDWRGRDKNGTQNLTTVGISKDYGPTVAWQFVKGRDYRTGTEGADARTFVINESAAKLMGFADPIGETVHWYGYDFTIIGVVKDMVMNSPWTPTEPTVFYMAPWRLHVMAIKMRPGAAVHDAPTTIGRLYTRYNPGQPFEYKFVDEEKEIGMRKVLGASVFSLWRLLSKDFLGLVAK